MCAHAEQVQIGGWRAHPLNKALLAQPISQPSLLLGVKHILSAASQSDADQQQQGQLLQQLLLPFVSFVLLQPDAQGMQLRNRVHPFMLLQTVEGRKAVCCDIYL